jgi:hypothetical protein
MIARASPPQMRAWAGLTGRTEKRSTTGIHSPSAHRYECLGCDECVPLYEEIRRNGSQHNA